MNASEFIADLQAAVPKFTRKRLLALGVLVLAFVLGLAVLVLLSHYVPEVDFERYGYLGVFLANLLPSLSVIIPAHFFFPTQALNVVVAAMGSVVLVALIASVASTLGEITAYYVGYGGKALLDLDRFERYRAAERWMERHGALAIIFFAFVPLFFFDFVGIAAGVLRYPLKKFLFFCFLGRLPKALVEIYFYTWIFKHVVSHLPEWMTGPFSG